MRTAAILVVLFWSSVVWAADIPIFDAHLHYNVEAHKGAYPVERVIAMFRKNNVAGVLANSRPNDGTHALVAANAPGLWVVPFMRPYRTRADIQTWFKDPEILAWIESEIATGRYLGIGEFHLHGADANTEGVKRIVEFAVARDLWLHAHSDEPAIAALYRQGPKAKVIWAHTGFSTDPAVVERYLKAYPSLMAELSYRSGVTEGGKLTAPWRHLFTTYPDRFLLGSDTWVTERWDRYDELIAAFRVWLAQLPPEIAEQIAIGNARRIFRAK
ncbi:MAG: amidohydrolase [Alphaproteobacteria bacterium]|nr:amidohydrolase [Alphaproteobacteria bacterium]